MLAADQHIPGDIRVVLEELITEAGADWRLGWTAAPSSSRM